MFQMGYLNYAWGWFWIIIWIHVKIHCKIHNMHVSFTNPYINVEINYKFQNVEVNCKTQIVIQNINCVQWLYIASPSNVNSFLLCFWKK
jgi:hypothetical protein